MPWKPAHGQEWWDVKRLCCGALSVAFSAKHGITYVPHDTSCPYHRWNLSRPAVLQR